MLINIDPLLSPDLLSTMQSMGHGDKLVICDANFPAHSGEISEALQGLFSGVDLRTNNDKYRKLY